MIALISVRVEDAPPVGRMVPLIDDGPGWEFTWRPIKLYGRWKWLFYRVHRFRVPAGYSS